MNGHKLNLASIERAAILEALRINAGNRSWAAKDLGISIRCLRMKLRSMRSEGVEVPESEFVATWGWRKDAVMKIPHWKISKCRQRNEQTE